MNSFYDFDYDKEKENIDLDLQAKSQALENLIQRQNEEDQKIKDDYDSMGSRATRFLEALGAGLRGENASNVVRSQRQDLSNQLTNNLNRFKNERDAAYGQYKDLLARRENLNNTAYNRQRDQVKDEQFNKNYELDKTKADRDYEIKDRTLRLTAAEQNAKGAQAQKDLELEAKNKFKDKVQSDLDIASAFNTGTMKDTSTGGWFSNRNTLKGSTIDKFAMKLVKDNLGIDPKEYGNFKKANPDIIPEIGDSETVVKEKLINLGYNPVKRISKPDKDGKQLIEYENGSLVIYDSKTDDYTEVQ